MFLPQINANEFDWKGTEIAPDSFDIQWRMKRERRETSDLGKMEPKTIKEENFSYFCCWFFLDCWFHFMCTNIIIKIVYFGSSIKLIQTIFFYFFSVSLLQHKLLRKIILVWLFAEEQGCFFWGNIYLLIKFHLNASKKGWKWRKNDIDLRRVKFSCLRLFIMF